MLKLFQHRFFFPSAFGISFIAFLLSLFSPLATPNTVVVAFDTAGGTPVEMVSVPGGGRLTTIPSTSKEGYEFEGWLKGNDPVTLQTVFTTNTTVRADFTQLEYTITYESNGGTAVEADVIKHGDTLRLPTPTKNNAVFQGWFTDLALTEIMEDNLEITRDYTLYAKWSNLGEDLFTVSFFSEGLGLIATETVAPNTTINLPTPTREGFTFRAWVNGETLEEVSGATYEVRSSVIFLAKWTSNAGLVTITFDSQGGTPIDPIQVPAGTPWQNPEDVPFLADGYQFLNWITNCNFDGFEVSCITLDENFIVEEDMTALARYDYMIPLTDMRFETAYIDNRIAGYSLVSVEDFSPEGTISTLILPSKFSGLPVIEIGEGAFSGLQYLDKVIIPENVLEIEWDAFYESSIKEVFLPSSLEIIRSGAFSYSTLEQVHFHDNSSLRIIEGNAFEESQLTQLSIPASVEYLGNGSFEGTPLTQVTFEAPSKLKYMNDDVFRETLITEITLPEGLISMDDDIFTDTTNLVSVHIPASVRFLGNSLFEDSTIDELTFGENSQILYVEDDTFISDLSFIINSTEEFFVLGGILIDYNGVKDDNAPLVIPEGVRVIYSRAFDSQVSPITKSSLTLPDSLVQIGDYAFTKAVIGSSVVIPEKVSIQYGAFMEVTIQGDLTIGQPKNIENNAFSWMQAGDVLLEALTDVQFNADSTLQNYTFRSAILESLTLGEGYEKLPYYFTETSQINAIYLPDSLSFIESGAIGSSTLQTLSFSGSSPLYRISTSAITSDALNSPWGQAQGAYVVVKNNLYRIRTSLLTAPYDLVIPEEVTVINQSVLDANISINSLDLNQVSYIYPNAFYQYNVNLSFANPVDFSNVTFLGQSFTFNDESLFVNGTFNFDESQDFDIETIYRSRLQYGTSTFLESLRYSIPSDDNGFRMIGNMLLSYEPSLDLSPEEVTIPSHIEMIGGSAFENVTFAGSLTLNEGLLYIAYSSFRNAQFLNQELTLPSSLKYIGNDAFAYSNLISITIPSAVEAIHEFAFGYINTLTTFEFESTDQLTFVAPSIFEYLPSNRNDLSPFLKSQLTADQSLVVSGIFIRHYGYQAHVTLDEGVTMVLQEAFSNRGQTIRSITLPSTLNYVAYQAFRGLWMLESVDFSDVVALRYLGGVAFGNTSLTSLTIAAPVAEIDQDAIFEMPYLTTWDINMTQPVELRLSYNYDLVD